MAEKTLLMYEVSQKQRYIFQSNKLRENVGASLIIRDLTEDPHSMDVFKERLPKAQYEISGGGSTLCIFTTKEEADEFAKTLSLGVLKSFPGVELFLVQKTVDWNEDKLDDGVIDEMYSLLNIKKDYRNQAIRQLSWGIHRLCPDSGLPANEYYVRPVAEETVIRSRELNVKAHYYDEARDVFTERFIAGAIGSNGQPLKFIDPNNFDLSEDENRSAKNYVAIIHIDGNAMGQKVASFSNRKFNSNDEYISIYNDFTKGIDDTYTKAFQQMIDHVMRDYELWSGKFYGQGEAHEERRRDHAHIIPLRPIVASGDDISFMSYGQLGIELARIFLQYLQQQSMMLNGERFSFEACAGVAIVRPRFPFWLAFELSERLCGNAKKRLKTDEDFWISKGVGTKNQPFDASLIDWEIITGGDIDMDLSNGREVSYRNDDQSYLLNRPYYLLRSKDYKWNHPANYITKFATTIDVVTRGRDESRDDNRISEARSKWKSLRDAYHQGVVAVEQWKKQNQFMDGTELFIQHSPQEQKTAYFYDAIATMDYMIKLSEVKTN